ncbi:MAG TPA: ABC transporter permease [Thermoleophilaceae bacterium]|nr:ABC transporter permease [Thermoleophilaceae bacterium]
MALIALITLYSQIAPNFLTWSNLTTVLNQSVYVGLIAGGMTLVILAGEIDVSVGSAAAFAGVVLALLLEEMAWPLALAATVFLGTFIGVVAGWIRAVFLIPSFIVTLALFGALRGLALLLTDAIPQAPEPLSNSFFTFLGSGKILELPAAVLLLLVLFAAFWFVSTKTAFGTHVYAVGGNPEASHLVGVPVRRVRITLFAITGGCAALSGIVLAAALGAGDPNVTQGLEFEVIAAVIVGGTSLYGGRGTMAGTVLGVLFIAVLGNGLVLMGIDPYANFVVRGLVVLAAVLVMSSTLRDHIRGVARRIAGRGRGRPTPRPTEEEQ